MPERRVSERRAAGPVGRVVLAAATLCGLLAPPAVGQAVPDPPSAMGYDPAAEGRLPSWSEIVSFHDALAAASPRVRLDTIGRSTLDAPLVVATISSAANLARLEGLREIQARLADPRRVDSPAGRDSLIERGRLVVLVTAGTHAAEVGGPIASMRLAHRLATSPTPRARRIREEAIVLVVPAVNPDGVDLVRQWHASTVDTPWHGSEAPYLYHHYAGHDLNRDWYAFTQEETRLVVRGVLEAWHPHVHHDLHQHEADWVRYFVPPWVDPVEPNVDPLLITAATSLGTRIQRSLLAEGKTGVAVAARYDAWSPSRAYVHYHGGVRILSETASARLAAPLEVPAEELRTIAGLDPRTASWNHPIPWPGGRWDLGDIVDYMESGVVATLGIAAGEREGWLRNFTRVGQRAVDGWPAWPEAWVIGDSRDPASAAEAELLRILDTAGVEVHPLTGTIDADGRSFGPGAYLVDMHQPYAAFAQAVLAPQPYPDRRAHPDGPPLAPYDATAHNLPLLLGVDAAALHVSPERSVSGNVLRTPPRSPPRTVDGLSGDPSVMVGLYRPWVPSPEEGWIRWLFDGYAIPYATVTNDDLAREGRLRDFTALLIPPVAEAVLRDGRSTARVPPEYAGGLGPGHTATLSRFVEDGGTLAAIGPAADFVIEALELPVENFVGSLRPRDFYAPGALVGLAVDTTTSPGVGMPAMTAAMVREAGAFRARTPDGAGRIRVIARYADAPVERSGWVIGGSWIAGRAAAVEVTHGAGRIVLFGFRPVYRGRAMATWPLLFNALKRRH